MPNHWHLLLVPGEAEALGRFLGWVGVTHVRRHHEHYHARGDGHLYQGRFRGFPVDVPSHFLSVARYVEANARRARLVRKAEKWPWGSAWESKHEGVDLPLAKWSTAKPSNWIDELNKPMSDELMKSLHESVNRGKPFGRPKWVEATAIRLGLTHTLRGAGRPKKAAA